MTIGTFLPIEVPTTSANSSTIKSMAAVDRNPSPCAFENGPLLLEGPQRVASDFVTALLLGDEPDLRALSDTTYRDEVTTWVRAFTETSSNGSVIATLAISNTAGRANVGVSVAFPPGSDGTITEPVAYLVSLIQSSNGWLVIDLAYA
jgi:hypothetical protein